MNGTQPQDDLTGRDRMAWNVLASWGGHFVFVIGGFIMPRLIDDRIGKESLGIWDFGWSLVTYFGLVSGGVMSSVGTFVARYRAADEPERVSATVSTGLLIYLCTGSIVLLLTGLVTWQLPNWYSEQLAGQIEPARWVVLFLGLSTFVQFVFAVFNGVITGCHRWGLHNGITAACYAIQASGMATAVLLGGGLKAISAVFLAGEVLAGIWRTAAAFRSYPQLNVSLRRSEKLMAKDMLGFGSKSLLESVSRIVLYQTNNLLIMGFLGKPAVAMFSRPMSLVRHVSTFVNKFAYVFTPTAGAMQAGQDRESLRNLLIEGTRAGLYLALPMVLMLAVLGNSLLSIWMGEDYVMPWVVGVLAIGHLAALSQRATYHILMGMGRHGVPGMAMLAAALVAVGLSVLTLGVLEWGLLGAAISVVLPLTLVNAIVLPWYAARCVGISYGSYALKSVTGPLLANLPYIGCMVSARIWFADDPLTAFVVGFGVGGLVLAGVYWRFALPASLKGRVVGRLFRRRAAVSGAAARSG
jgi:O-antigen/teichoic acid export membrane protein